MADQSKDKDAPANPKGAVPADPKGTAPAEAKDHAADAPAAKGEPKAAPGEAFRAGVGLLWQAARGAADEIKREVAKGNVSEAVQRAGRDLEQAAAEAAKAIEGFLGRIGPGDPKTSPWPGAGPPPADEAPAAKAPASKAEPKDDDEPNDDAAKRRDMRIHLDDD
jgi:hypothetical protein